MRKGPELRAARAGASAVHEPLGPAARLPSAARPSLSLLLPALPFPPLPYLSSRPSVPLALQLSYFPRASQRLAAPRPPQGPSAPPPPPRDPEERPEPSPPRQARLAAARAPVRSPEPEPDRGLGANPIRPLPPAR